jgi:transposase
MGKAYSLDLRTRVIAFLGSGKGCKAAASHFSLGYSTVLRWNKAYKEEERIAPKPIGKGRKPKLDVHSAWLLEQIARDSSISMREICAALYVEKAIRSSTSMVWRFFDQHNISFKKKHFTPKSKSMNL